MTVWESEIDVASEYKQTRGAFSYPAFLWNDHMAPEYLDWIQPVIVVWEVTERRMRILADPLDPRIPLIGE